ILSDSQGKPPPLNLQLYLGHCHINMNATSKIGQSLCSYRIDRYKLDGHDPILCEDLVSWLRWMETTGRWVQDSQFIDSARNPVRVCTVFLGIDMAFG